jgi:hypothetical protein
MYPDSVVRPSGNVLVVWKETLLGSVQSKVVNSGPYYEQREGTSKVSPGFVQNFDLNVDGKGRSYVRITSLFSIGRATLLKL